jgi:hypothetical protein
MSKGSSLSIVTSFAASSGDSADGRRRGDLGALMPAHGLSFSAPSRSIRNR